MRSSLLILLLFALAACAAPTPGTVSPTMTAPVPVSTGEASTDVATQVTEAPVTVDSVSMTELGITDPILAYLFQNVDNTVTREDDGTFSVKATSYEGETAVEGKYIIDTTTFSDNPEIKNEYAPLTVKATDSHGKQVTLIWYVERHNWHEVFNVESIPYMPKGEEKIMIESALLYFKDHAPFNDQAVESYKKCGGNSLLFQHYTDFGNEVVLKSKGNDQIGLNSEKATMKFTNVGVYYEIGGNKYLLSIVVLLDPEDPQSPWLDEFKVFLGGTGIPVRDDTSVEKRKDLLRGLSGSDVFLFPVPVLYSDGKFLTKYPLRSELISIPNNNPADILFFGPALTYTIDILSDSKKIIETQPYGEPLPASMQSIIWFLGSASVK